MIGRHSTRRFDSVLLALAALAALDVLTPSVGQAEPYPWCAQYSGGRGGGGRNCGFATLEQCRATVFGIGGFCEPNLFYTGRAEKPAKRVRKHRYDD
jgi:Protein of unknown function (DUF3551)